MRGRYSNGPPIGGYAFCLLCIGVGVVFGAPDHDTAQKEREQECAPVAWHTGDDVEAWQMLVDQGYRPVEMTNGTALVPPGCEGETP